jgi:hypothetical protein
LHLQGVINDVLKVTQFDGSEHYMGVKSQLLCCQTLGCHSLTCPHTVQLYTSTLPACGLSAAVGAAMPVGWVLPLPQVAHGGLFTCNSKPAPTSVLSYTFRVRSISSRS